MVTSCKASHSGRAGQFVQVDEVIVEILMPVCRKRRAAVGQQCLSEERREFGFPIDISA